MDKNIVKSQRKIRRKVRSRAKIFGTAKKPRLTVSRSLKNIYCQLIDDENQKTIASANDTKAKGNKIEKAKLVGQDIAKKAAAKKVEQVVFDRSGYKYHGRVKALAEGAREAGLKF